MTYPPTPTALCASSQQVYAMCHPARGSGVLLNACQSSHTQLKPTSTSSITVFAGHGWIDGQHHKPTGMMRLMMMIATWIVPMRRWMIAPMMGNRRSRLRTPARFVTAKMEAPKDYCQIEEEEEGWDLFCSHQHRGFPFLFRAIARVPSPSTGRNFGPRFPGYPPGTTLLSIPGESLVFTTCQRCGVCNLCNSFYFHFFSCVFTSKLETAGDDAAATRGAALRLSWRPAAAAAGPAHFILFGLSAPTPVPIL